MNNSSDDHDHGTDEMEDRDMNVCVTSLSGPHAICTTTSTTSTVQDEIRLAVEELTVKNMRPADSANFLCSPSSCSTSSRLQDEQSHRFYPVVLSELIRSSRMSQSRTQIINSGFQHYHSMTMMLPPHSDTGRHCLGTCGSLGHMEETCLSCQQQQQQQTAVDDSCQRSVGGIRKEVIKHEFINHGRSMYLRDWLRSGYSRGINKTEGLLLFRQIVELVDLVHSQDIILQELRPSRFILLPSNKVRYVGSSVRISARQALMMNSDSKRKRTWVGGAGAGGDINPYPHFTGSKSKHREKLGLGQEINTSISHGQDSISMCSELQAHRVHGSVSTPLSIYSNDPVVVQLEEQWYTSPEQGSPSVSAGAPSNIYCLGVLLFELLCSFESPDAHEAAMSDLQRRILPSGFLSENPKEAGFCLLFVHPEYSSRPTAREILQSDLFDGPLDCYPTQSAALSSNESYLELERLLQFLASLKEQKIRQESKLIADILYIEEDISKVQKSCFPITSVLPSFSLTEETKWMNIMGQMEECYFLTRSQPGTHDTEEDPNRNLSRHHGIPSNKLGHFSDVLCKFARYTKLQVCGSLKYGELLNAANVIRSIGFSRDEEYIATAGVSKKIKVFEFSTLLDDSIDIHYPAVEMSNKNKLSCVCWNSYMRSFLASTDYGGLVQIWDVVTAQSLSQYNEHEKRAWCVDFCLVDPTRFASGSDDCSVKLWRINERNSVGTIWNPANVCCVQFSSHSTNLLALGCADNNIYCYDLRNTRVPLCTLSGHGKTVSYVKFLDFETIVSASTDNSLKMWNIKGRSSDSLSSDCIRTFKGHTNEKNFVGLSVFDGYIACGSENNEVYCYYKSLPMPITSHKFGSLDPASELVESGSEDRHFVSSVCWGQKTNMVVAANSAGILKVLQMV
ncbi:hypothetical protein SAY86_020430 [Trapa natans]|uniref:Uncharacterized protein n=1 Tax=Trapa natans TaxID=22666 RepID=A0AAN7M3C4_TRANT|nr:hypothetical protein SAY86_020430 [Trapa natans]